MGSIRARSDNNKLFFEFRYEGKRCREQTSLADTPVNRRNMEKVLQKIDAELTLGSFDYLAYFPGSKKAAQLAGAQKVMPSKPPAGSASRIEVPYFEPFAKIWLMENRVRWRIATIESQEGLLRRHILPRFGSCRVNEISKADVLEFRAERATVEVAQGTRTLSPKTINEIVGTLKVILDEAADRYDFPSPAEHIKRLKVPKRDIKPFSLVEVRQVIESVREDYRAYMTVRFFTGMRSGEVHGLKWKFIDFERRQILIRETWGKGRTEYTKNDGSQREINMSDRVFNALKVQREATGSLSEYVFCNQAGNPLDNTNFTDRVWYPLLRYLGLEKRRPYECRHTAATMWLAAGESPEWIARQLGHSSTEMLFKVYSRYVPNLTRNDGSAFENLLTRELGDMK
jgi:integrase